MIAGKGSFAAPLFFLSLAFACAGSRLGSVWPWAAAAAILLLIILSGGTQGRLQSWLALTAFGYALLVLLDASVASGAYSAAGLYHPLILALGFLAARRLGQEREKWAALGVLALGLLLAVWGLVQIGPLGQARAAALFEAPATYAAVINLVLVPALAFVLMGKRGALRYAVSIVLASALIASDSRGGLLALGAGAALAGMLALHAQLLKGRGVAAVLAVIAAGGLAAAALRLLPAPHSEISPSAAERMESSMSRLELYSLSWSAWRDRPVRGTGYLTFRYTLEQGRTDVPSYGASNFTWFVHNDYLQTLQELGLVGFVPFLGLAWLPLLLAYRRLPHVAEGQRPAVVASASALAAMSVHAMVDFPFYVPACLLLYGALLGVLDARLRGTATAREPLKLSSSWARAARTGALAIAAIVFLRPVAAEAAAEWGLRKFAGGHGQQAAFWLGAAQKIDPRDWRYHWYAGQFWEAQAADSGRSAAANLAARAYAAGFAANPLEVRNLLGMISVQRRYRQLLDQPAAPATLQGWIRQAAALAPLNPAVQLELAR